MDQNKKQNMLIKSLHVLERDCIKYGEEIRKIIVQLWELDYKLAIHEWELLLRNNMELFEPDFYDLGFTGNISSYIIWDVYDHPEFVSQKEDVLKNEILVEILYGKAINVNDACLQMLSDYIKAKNFVAADRLIDLIYNNENLEDYNFAYYLERLIDLYLYKDHTYGSCLISTREPLPYDNETIEFIQKWIDKLYDDEDIARVNSVFMQIC